MSTNKTVFPGLDNDYNAQDAQSLGQRVNGNYYDGNNGRCGTFFPGMSGMPKNNGPQKQGMERSVRRKPLVGFLYSISRGEMGEFWPLYIGQNTIGASPESDIRLNEATVSQDHAVIMVRKMKNPEKIIASISDARSTNGTMINDRSLGFVAETCENGDVITFGESYQCLLILIDPKIVGLSISTSFIHVEDEGVNNEVEMHTPNCFDSSRNQSSEATIGIYEEEPVYNGGGTVGM